MDKTMKKLLESIGEKRYAHSVRVMNEAKKLAAIYGVDIEKAAIAGLMHDCARFEDKSYLLKKSNEFGIILDKIYTKNVNLLHAPLGAEVARLEYNISDTDVLNAIKYHTTGRADMSMLEKIVYMADYIEPVRNFDGIEQVRDICYREKDIDKALKQSIDNTIRYILDREEIIHAHTISARNYLLYNTK